MLHFLNVEAAGESSSLHLVRWGCDGRKLCSCLPHCVLSACIRVVQFVARELLKVSATYFGRFTLFVTSSGNTYPMDGVPLSMM